MPLASVLLPTLLQMRGLTLSVFVTVNSQPTDLSGVPILYRSPMPYTGAFVGAGFAVWVGFGTLVGATVFVGITLGFGAPAGSVGADGLGATAASCPCLDP